MSYAAVRKRNQEVAQPVHESVNCWASGCPCRGTVSLEGGKFLCTAHAFIVPERWPAVTDLLRDNSWLLEFMRDIKGMEAALEDWRPFAVQFWASQGEENAICAPHPQEAYSMYETRMRKELLHRCRLGKQPAPRIPTGRGKPGNLGQLLRARA